MAIVIRKFFVADDCAYNRVGMLGDPCTYCGVEAFTWDHVPPLSQYSLLDEELREESNPRMFPCCQECNSFLGARLLLTVKARRKFIKEKLQKKYRKFLSMPKWDEDELEELSERLADDIRRASIFAEYIKGRLTFHR